MVWPYASLQAASKEKYKTTAGWSCCYNIFVLLDSQKICFLQPLMFFRGTTRSTCEEELSFLANQVFVKNHICDSQTLLYSQSWADESAHKMCDTGRASKSAAPIILKFLFRKSLSSATALSEVPWPAGVHEVFVGHFLMWSSCAVLWVNFITWPFSLPRSHFMNEFMESLL